MIVVAVIRAAHLAWAKGYGTDVGHQYHTTGNRFLKYLKNNNLEGSEQYLLAQETIEQGEYFYKHDDHVSKTKWWRTLSANMTT